MNKLLARLNMRQFYMSLAGLVLLLSAASTSFLVLPQYKKFRGVVAEQAKLPPLPADSAGLQAMLSEREEAVTASAKALHGDMASLPLREVEAYVIDRVQGIAWNHNVELQGVRPAAGETVNAFSEVLFKLDVEGHYVDLFEWLKELRTELGFIVIKEFRMDRKSVIQDEPVLRVQMTVASYRRDLS